MLLLVSTAVALKKYCPSARSVKFLNNGLVAPVLLSICMCELLYNLIEIFVSPVSSSAVTLTTMLVVFVKVLFISVGTTKVMFGLVVSAAAPSVKKSKVIPASSNGE